jgi:hypothetical protein
LNILLLHCKPICHLQLAPEEAVSEHLNLLAHVLMMCYPPAGRAHTICYVA